MKQKNLPQDNLMSLPSLYSVTPSRCEIGKHPSFSWDTFSDSDAYPAVHEAAYFARIFFLWSYIFKLWNIMELVQGRCVVWNLRHNIHWTFDLESQGILICVFCLWSFWFQPFSSATLLLTEGQISVFPPWSLFTVRWNRVSDVAEAVLRKWPQALLILWLPLYSIPSIPQVDHFGWLQCFVLNFTSFPQGYIRKNVTATPSVNLLRFLWDYKLQLFTTILVSVNPITFLF